MVLGWLSAAALGGSAAEEVHGTLSRYPTADAIASCAPFSAVTGLVRTVPLPPALASSPIPRVLVDLSVEGGAQSAGIDEAGAVTLVTHPDRGLKELRLPFTGTVEQAGALVQRLDPSATGAEGQWVFAVKGVPHRATLSGGTLSLASGETSGASAEPGAGPLEGIPAVPGCAAWLRPPAEKAAELSFDSVALFVPLEGGAPAVLRVDGPKPLPAAISRTDAAIPEGRSPDPPTMVLTMSAPVDDLLALLAAEMAKDPLVQQEEGPGPAEMLAQLQRVVRLPDGAAIAFHGNPRRGGQWVALLRITDPRGEPYKAKRLVRVAARTMGELGVERTGKDSLVVVAPKNVLYVRVADDGRVAIGSNPVLPALALAEEGAPWLDEAALAEAHTAPLLLQSFDPTSDLTFAIRAVSDTAVELVVDVKMSEEQRKAMQANLGPMIGMMVPLLMMQGTPGAPNPLQMLAPRPGGPPR